MNDIATGTLVKHASLGVGKVVAIEATAVHVFFPGREGRYAAKLRWPDASALLTREGVEPDAWLAGLTSFALDAKTSRYGLAANFLTHEEAVAEFLRRFPRAFADPAYAGDGTGKRERASRWRAASREWADAFGDGEGERLLADGALGEVVRRALRVARHATLVPGAMDRDALEEALQPGDAVAAFFEALFGVVSAPSPARSRFESLFAASHALGLAPSLAWPAATLFPFVADPARHALLLPKPACAAAARLGCDLAYEPAPNWATYAAFHAMSNRLLDALRPLGARDLVDVEPFLHAVGTPAPRSKR